VDRSQAEAALAVFDARRAADAPVEPAMAALLDRLRGRVRLGLLSNAGSGARARLEALGVTKPFDDVVCSGDVGLAKPDPAIFRLPPAGVRRRPASSSTTAPGTSRRRSVGMAHHHHRSRLRERSTRRAGGRPALGGLTADGAPHGDRVAAPAPSAPAPPLPSRPSSRPSPAAL
jgi:hypothetical protein